MPVLSVDQLIALASDVGFSGNDLATAVAVAIAESGGNPQAYNPEVKAGAAEGAGSYGLWQIYLTAHPQFSAAQLVSNPAYNAAAAYTVYQQAGYSFMPWSTFKYGLYQKYMPQVQSRLAAQQSPDQVATDTSGNGGDGGTPPPDNSTLITIVTVSAVLLGLVMYFRG